MAVGNHEYNFGLKCLNRARADASFPWLSANTEVAPGGSDKPFDAYVVKSVDGVRLAIVGLTTPAVPTWEKPENMGSYRFLPPVEPARRAVEKARREGRADLVIVAAHMGLARNRATGALESTPENPALDVARQVAGVDAMVTGHTHEELSGERIGTVLVAQPKNGGVSLARLDFTLEMRGGRWTPVSAASRLLLVKDSTPADAAILDLARPYHELAERYLATPVAVADQALEGTFGRVEDTPLVDAIQAVQLYYSKADVSLTSMFNTRARVPRGPVTVRQIVALYPYDNELYVIAATGRMLREALENAARYFVSCQGETCAGPPLINRAVPGFDFDMAQGVEYEIDLTRPAGSRVRNLRWHGRPLAPEQKLRLALNNYRAAGSAGYEMFRGAPILWQSGEEIRDLMVRYFTARKQFPDAADGNWRIVPDAARETLKRQAVAAARRPSEDQ
jgi:2',3'-cyclic-nucleotide 2'-phosphodiesterase/3'-nucleotidase